MAQNNTNNTVDKLRGRENYGFWKVTCRSYLTIKGYWKCFQNEMEPTAAEKDQVLYEKALSEIFLMVEENCLSHIENKTSAKSAWDALAAAYDDSGANRRCTILQNLVNIKFKDCKSMEAYIDKLLSCWGKTKVAGYKIDEDVIASLMLGGLPSEYRPMVMGIETSSQKLTVDYVKNLLLQEVTFEKAEEAEKVLMVKDKTDKRKKKKGPIKCYGCGGNHFFRKCPVKKGNDNALLTTFLVNSSNDWFIDSGASAHMTNNRSVLRSVRQSQKKDVTAANNEKMAIECIGDVVQSIQMNGKLKDLRIEGVHCIPDLSVNLLSVAQMVLKGLEVIFNRTGCRIYNQERSLVASGSFVNNMFRLDTMEAAVAYKVGGSTSDVTLWHRRLGHSALSKMSFIKDHLNVEVNFKNSLKCVTCVKGKQARLSFKVDGTRATELLQLVHSDVCGPMATTSMGGARYYITFIDDYSRKTFVYVMKNKNEAVKCFENFKALVENQLNRRIKTLRTDNGLEYCNESMKTICERDGVMHQKSCAYVHEQNGVAERMNRIIMDRVRCMLIDSGLEKTFWAEAVSTAVYLINRVPCRDNKTKTPEEFWTGSRPDLSILRVFGCLAMKHVPNEKRKKLEAKSIESVFVGYGTDSKGYRLYEPSTRKVSIARDVTFFEDKKLNSVRNKPGVVIIDYQGDFEENLQYEDDVSGSEESEETSLRQSDGGRSGEGTTTGVHADDRANSSSSSIETIVDPNDETYNPDETLNDSFHPLRPATRSVTANRTENANVFNFANDASTLYAFVMNEPEKYEEAVSCEQKAMWKGAMDEEFNALIKNKTWILVNLPSGKQAIDNRWIYKIKMKSNGEVERYKARLVIRGFTQRYGVNYFETFSPVVKFTSIRAILAIAASKGMQIKQFDVKTAFLNSDLEEEVFMRQPKGYEDNSGRVCKLQKSLYGLKQASRCWNRKFTGFLRKFSFVECQADPCVFVLIKGEIRAYLTIHIDDGLLVSNNATFMNDVIEYLKTGFEMTITDVDCYLGVQIERKKDGSIFIHQSNYAKKLLKKFNMDDAKTMAVPADPNQVLCKHEADGAVDFPYREAVGSLMYLSVATRPDISYIVGVVSRFLEKPAQMHVNAVKRIFKYINSSIEKGILFKNNVKLNLNGYSDADYGGDIDERRSTTGYLFLLGSTLVSWSSERQKSVALSTTESEYVAAAQAVKELLWIGLLLKNLQVSVIEKPNLFVDNQSAIRLIKNPEFHKRTKHIDIKYHFVRQKFGEGLFNLDYVRTELQLADILTKALGKQKFDNMCKMIGLKKFDE